MTVQDLIDALQSADPNAEVRLATQPQWPMEYTLTADPVELDGVVYLAAADQLGYLPGDAADQLGWG